MARAVSENEVRITQDLRTNLSNGWDIYCDGMTDNQVALLSAIVIYATLEHMANEGRWGSLLFLPHRVLFAQLKKRL